MRVGATYITPYESKSASGICRRLYETLGCTWGRAKTQMNQDELADHRAARRRSIQHLPGNHPDIRRSALKANPLVMCSRKSCCRHVLLRYQIDISDIHQSCGSWWAEGGSDRSRRRFRSTTCNFRHILLYSLCRYSRICKRWLPRPLSSSGSWDLARLSATFSVDTKSQNTARDHLRVCALSTIVQKCHL